MTGPGSVADSSQSTTAPPGSGQPAPFRLVVVGGGRMGEALLGGLVAAGWCRPEELAVLESVAERRTALVGRFEGVTVVATVTGLKAAGAVVAVKPPDVQEACRVIATTGATRVLSIAAGVRLGSLASWLGPGARAVRAMPNTPALVGAGVAAMAVADSSDPTSEEDLAWAESILAAVGRVERVAEADLDAVTAVSGSGPAYVFLLVEALADAGISAGLSREVSHRLARATVAGAGRLLEASDTDPRSLRAAVTSPGGTTAAAVGVLEEGGWPQLMAAAVAAATRRSRELGGS
ncbi:MAG: pyrroline-5-carboxylate reductase [Acidimicrobiales bacterium]